MTQGSEQPASNDLPDWLKPRDPKTPRPAFTGDPWSLDDGTNFGDEDLDTLTGEEEYDSPWGPTDLRDPGLREDLFGYEPGEFEGGGLR